MINRICKQCGEQFTLADSEIQFYKSKDLELPKRCSDCRKKNNSNSSTEGINSNIGNVEEISKNNKPNENNKNTRNKKNVFTSIIAAVLVVLTLFVGKVFDIDISTLWKDNNYSNEQGMSLLNFRNERFLEEHFVKHGKEFGYKSKEEYLAGANKIINSSSALHKQEGEDGDDIYYDKNINEIVFVSGDGYIRTYFKPSEGIDYYNRQ